MHAEKKKANYAIIKEDRQEVEEQKARGTSPRKGCL